MVTQPTLRFVGGTLEITGVPESTEVPGATWDARTGCYRAPANTYAAIVLAWHRSQQAYTDEARRYGSLANGACVHREPRPYQAEALAAWLGAQKRGVVVLPTGAGKSQLACMAISEARRDTLVIAPTLDLVRQWHDLLRATFAMPVGIIGGGSYEVLPLTVSTYDSAYLHMEHLGARFGMLVFDECHHLPSPTYAMAAQLALAPYRLGLTATPERTDGKEAWLTELIGPEIYRKDIVELTGDYLAAYDTEKILVELAPHERAEYDEARAIYRGFLQRSGIRMGDKDGWSQFIMMSARSVDGRRAMAAYRRQRALAFCAPAKLDYVDHLLERHRHERTILFTQDNATCYQVSRRFLLPAITHQTPVRERSDMLARFAEGTYTGLVTSKVLNEGVDIPAASVAVVISGSGSVREHVQRLGRILRKQEGKQAVLYELITAETSEAYTSLRRREHSAYR